MTSDLGGGNTGLLTDQYELTMVRGALHSGVAQRRAVFEVFARHLPHGRRYGGRGIDRLLDAVARSGTARPSSSPARHRVADETTLRYLESYAFGGNIWGYAEGDCYFPGSPILVVEGTFAEAVVLETLCLSILNHDCAIASAASRMVIASGDRPLIEMGSRRTHEMAAVASARAAYIAGFTFTSNLRAGHEYGVPTSGTAAHAFTLVHDSEREAFSAQIDSLGASTTLLVDTYDVETAVRTAVEVAGPNLGAVRIDSGDLLTVARRVRALLDSLGATKTRIVVSGDLDEYSIAALAADAGRRLRRGHVASHRLRGADRRAGVQAGSPGRRAWRCGLVAPGGEAVGGQAGAPRAQVGDAPPRRRWDSGHRADHHHTARSRAGRPGAAATADRARQDRRPGTAGGGALPPPEVIAELPAFALQLSRGYRAVPTVFEPDGD